MVIGWHQLSTSLPRLIRSVRYASRGKIGELPVLSVITGFEANGDGSHDQRGKENRGEKLVNMQ